MSEFEPGQDVFTINSRVSRATPGKVISVTDMHVEVLNEHKDEYQYFAIEEPHEALGDYWAEGERRPRLVPTSDALARRLDREATHRRYSEDVRLAARTFHDRPSTRAYVALKDTVEEWGNWVATWEG